MNRALVDAPTEPTGRGQIYDFFAEQVREQISDHPEALESFLRLTYSENHGFKTRGLLMEGNHKPEIDSFLVWFQQSISGIFHENLALKVLPAESDPNVTQVTLESTTQRKLYTQEEMYQRRAHGCVAMHIELSELETPDKARVGGQNLIKESFDWMTRVLDDTLFANLDTLLQAA